MIDINNTFTKMQQSTYDQLAIMDSDRNYNGNPLQEYDKYYEERMWRYIPDLRSKSVLDFGCGPGRNLVHYTGKVKSIDGVDISAGNLVTARQWLRNNNFNVDNYKLYKNNGVELDGISDQTYDVVMSTIVLQHISVHKIRYNFLSEFYRVLKTNGYVTLQFLYSTDKPNTVGYFDNAWVAQGTNGASDCVVGDVTHVIKDLESVGFGNINYFIDQAYTTGGVPPRSTDDKEWLFITAQKL